MRIGIVEPRVAALVARCLSRDPEARFASGEELREALEVTRTVDGKVYVVMPSGLVESGPDFDRVRFKVS